jgi:Response regulator containing a CheY-like receiver domain and an HTH DNA-binding domain
MIYEFYTTPEGEVSVKTETGTHELSPNADKAFVISFDKLIEEFYSQAHAALQEVYRSSLLNVSYFKFLGVRRFIKCNFGSFDNVVDFDGKDLHFEFVKCPLRGECKFDGVICNPHFQHALSEREAEVMKLQCSGLTDAEIADKLFISMVTVANHRKNSLRKTGVHSLAEFQRYAIDKNIFLHV